MSDKRKNNAVFDAIALQDFASRVLCYFGVDSEFAAAAAELLVTSDLRGIDSHGVARLWVYAKWLEEGHAKPNPDIQVLRETAATVAFDGDHGLGIVVGPEVHRRVIEKAEVSGAVWSTVNHSNHFGIAGYYALKAVEADMIGMVFSNATAQMYPVGSTQPMLGTNPIAMAFPAGDERPVVIDMATSTAAFGKIEIAHRQQKEIPEGWVVAPDGSSVTQTHHVYNEPHALSPLGSVTNHAVHKGYCLAAAADLFSGVLSGSAWGPHCPHFFFPDKPYSDKTSDGLGHCFSVMRVDGLMDPVVYRSRIDQWIREFRSATPIDPSIPVQVPGEPEWKIVDERSRNGIPLNSEVVRTLDDLARKTKIQFDA